MKKLLFICFCFISIGTFGQSPKAVEADLVRLFMKINPWASSGPFKPHTNLESLESANNLFANKLHYYTNKYPFTISQKFKSFDPLALGYTTSADGLLRIYFWNTGTGGTQQDYMNVFQYKTGDKTHSIIKSGYEGNIKTPAFDTIYTFKKNNKIYYIACYNAEMEINEYINGVQIFSIENGILNDDVKLIKTSTGLHSRLEYSFVLRDDYPDNIAFDQKLEILKLPVILENGQANGNYITYKFTGTYFEKVKNPR